MSETKIATEHAARTEHGTGPEYESKLQLAARLGVSPRTIDNLMTRGLPRLFSTNSRREAERDQSTGQWSGSLAVRKWSAVEAAGVGGVRPRTQPMCRCRIWRLRLAGTRTVTGEFCGDSSAIR